MLYFVLSLVLSPFLFAAPHPNTNKLPIENILQSDFETSVRTLQRYGEQSHSSLETLAFDVNQSMETRWKSLMVLTKIARKQSLPVIEKALHDPNWFMRSAGLTALHDLDKKMSLKKAFQKLKSDPALMVRMKAFEILRGNQNDSIKDLFWLKLNSSDSFHQNKSLWIRYDLALELLQSPRKKDLKRWVAVLHGADAQLQNLASQALSQLTGQVVPQSENHVSYWQEKYPATQQL